MKQHTSVDPVFQIGIIFALSSTVLLVTLAWSSRQRRSATVPNEARRVLVALERASFTALKRRVIKLPIPLGFAAVVLVLAQLSLRGRASPSLSFATVASAPLLVIAGAAMTIVLAWFTIIHLRSHAFSVWTGTLTSSARALTSCWSASISLLLAAEILGIISVIGLYGLIRMFVRDVPPVPPSSLPNAMSTALTAAELTAVFGVGAVVAALWLQHMGSCCLGAASLGAGSAFVRQTGLEESDPRNPAVLIDTLSRQLGEALPRVLDAFVTSCLVSSLTLLLLHHPAVTNTGIHASPIATIPLVLRGFGVLASLFGLLTIRSLEHENLDRAVLRSHVVAEIVFASATVGTILWIVGSWSLAVAIAILLGVTFPALIAYLRSVNNWYGASRRIPTEGVSSEANEQTAELWGKAIKIVSLLPIAVYAVVLLLATVWQQRLARGDSLLDVALLIGLAAPSALSSWHAAPSLALGIHATAGLSGTLGRVPITEAFTRRRRRLASAIEQLTLRLDPVVTDGGVMLCGLAALVITSWSETPSPRSLVPALIAVTLLAVLPGMVLLGDYLHNGARSARTQATEVERQLRSLRRDGNRAEVPVDFVPSYRSCVELLARDASRGGLLPVALTILLPLLTALAGVGTENSPGSLATLLAMYVSVAAATGLAVMHAGHATPLASSLANRYRIGRLPARTESETRPSSFELVDFLRRSIAVSVPLLTKATTLVALAVAAMLT